MTHSLANPEPCHYPPSFSNTQEPWSPGMLSCFTKGHIVSLIPTFFAVHFMCSACAFWFSEHDSCLLSYSANGQITDKRSNGLADWKWKKVSLFPWAVGLFKECTDFLAPQDQMFPGHLRRHRKSRCSPYILRQSTFFFFFSDRNKSFSPVFLSITEKHTMLEFS